MAKKLVLYFSVYGTAKAVAEEIAERIPLTGAGTGTRRRNRIVAAIVASSGVERISFRRKPPSLLPRSLAMP